MAVPTLHRDAALTTLTNGWFEVELFEPWNEHKRAHTFRDYTQSIVVAQDWIRAWIDEGRHPRQHHVPDPTPRRVGGRAFREYPS